MRHGECTRANTSQDKGSFATRGASNHRSHRRNYHEKEKQSRTSQAMGENTRAIGEAWCLELMRETEAERERRRAGTESMGARGSSNRRIDVRRGIIESQSDEMTVKAGEERNTGRGAPNGQGTGPSRCCCCCCPRRCGRRACECWSACGVVAGW